MSEHKENIKRKCDFSDALPVSPVQFRTWPAKRDDNLYWVLKKDFTLEKIPGEFSIRIAADRHYEIFINSKSVAKQQNYFNAGNYLFGQRWDYGENSEIEASPSHCSCGLDCKDKRKFFKKGVNTIEILVRTDIFGSEAPRCKQRGFPLRFIFLEASC